MRPLLHHRPHSQQSHDRSSMALLAFAAMPCLEHVPGVASIWEDADGQHPSLKACKGTKPFAGAEKCCVATLEACAMLVRPSMLHDGCDASGSCAALCP